MICAFCKADIESDSFYCDQCGQEILVCPKCNKPGKGKVCTQDGTSLVTAKSLSSTAKVGVGGPQLPPAPAGELHLINRTLNLDIKITKDALIGRLYGDFVDIFGKYDTVSGRHLKIVFDPQKGWLATDLGSTNGTKYNNLPLVPNQPQVLADKSYLQIANIEFFIEIKKPTPTTGTRRI
ncbi:MAG: FHA domain-containing protein [candidate division WOR-3 bacterium]